MKLKQRLLSIMLVLAMLVTYMPITNVIVREVHAEEPDPLNISGGDIIIYKSTYKQGNTTKDLPSTINIIGSSNRYTVTIEGYEGDNGPVTLSNLNISSASKAPVRITSGSSVTLEIAGTCNLTNTGTANENKAYAWPGICIDSGKNEVLVTGSGNLYATGGQYCPAIGGACSDIIKVADARASEFNSTVTLDVDYIYADGGTFAPNIGTGRGCNVVSGSGFIFNSGEIIATEDNGNSVGIGVCESASLKGQKLVNNNFKSDLTLSFTGAHVEAEGSYDYAAIGAGDGQSIAAITISGGSITATAEGSAYAIGNHVGNSNMPNINIKGGTVIATGNVTDKSPIHGNIDVSEYVDMSLELNCQNTHDGSVRILHKEYTDDDDYISSGFSKKGGTYYEKFIANPSTSSMGKTCKYVKISKCTKHENVSTPSKDKPDYTHNGCCIYCDHVSDGENHNWIYTTEGTTLTETCKNCPMTHSVTLAETTTHIYDGGIKLVSPSAVTTVTKPVYTYRRNGSTTDLPGPPTEVGKYTATTSWGDSQVTVKLNIIPSPMDIQVTNPEWPYDGKPHTIDVQVNTPTNAAITYSTDGASFVPSPPAFTIVGKHQVLYKVECPPNYDPVVGVAYVTINPKLITGLTITGIDQPLGGQPLDTEAVCNGDGITSEAATVHWVDEKGIETVGNAKFNTKYKCYVNVIPDREKYAFNVTSTSAVTIAGSTPSKVMNNPDGSLTVYREFDTTDKAEISRVSRVYPIVIEHGAEKSPEGLGLPKTVSVTCDDADIKTLPVEWDVAACSYNKSNSLEQNFEVNGTIVNKYAHVKFASGISSGTAINVTVLAARTKSIEANLTESEYGEEQTLKLRKGLAESDVVYYTINGYDPFVSETEQSENALICTEAGIKLTCEEGQSKTYHVQARAKGDGLRPSELFDKTYTITVADKTAPTATIKIGTKSWQQFLSEVTFGLFTTDKYEVEISATDNREVKEVSYFVSDHAYTSLAEIESNANWKPYAEKFTISNKNKCVVYAKAVDANGNAGYANSDGLVIYTNSAASTTSVNVTPNVTESVNFTVTLNGNDIAGMKFGATPVAKENYKVNLTNGEVTLYSPAFSNLGYGAHTLTISYKPQGVDYKVDDENTAPETTELIVKVVKPKVTSIATPATIDGVSNGTQLKDIKLPDKVGITTDPETVTGAAVKWYTDKVYSGSYDPGVLVPQKFVLRGEVQLSGADVDLTGISKEVFIEVHVNSANQLAKPMPSIKEGSYANKVTVSLTSSDNAEIYYTLDNSTPTTSSKRYTEPITLTETTTIKAICHLDGRFDSDEMSVKYTIVFVDESAPTGSIAIGKESFWEALWSGTLYQFFTKTSQVVTISGKDDDSGIKAIFYYISPVELDKKSLEEVTSWEVYTEPLHLDPNISGIIYAKIINGDDVCSYVNSNGIVVFTDPEKVTDSVTYVKGSGNDVEFTVKLNGNSINAMRNGGTTLSPSHYSQTFSGNIVLSASYLETLGTGNYTFYVDYYPMGINNSNAAGNSVAPASTPLKVLVSAKSTGANTGTGSNTGGSSSGIPNVPIVIPQDPNFEGNATGTTTKTDSSGVVHHVETVTYTDKSKTITDTSTSKDKTKTVVVTEKDAKGATTTVATKITTQDGTETYTVTEYVSANETKTTTNKSDTKGNTYERVYVTNKNGSSSESIVSTVNDVKTTDVYKIDVSGNLSQTYSTTQELNGEIIDVTVKGSGTQTSPKYTESYTLVEDGLDVCNVTVTRTNSKATAMASVVKTNEAGNKVVISADLLDDMLTAASWNDVNGSLPNVSTVHTFSTKRKAVSDIDVTYKVMNDSGNKRYTLMFNTDDIVAGNKIRQFIYTGGKYIMLGANYKTVSDSGNLSITPDKNYTYLLAGPETYKNINDSIKKSAVFANTSTAQVPKGKSTYFKLDDEFDSRNVKSITYKSKNGLVASVNNSGKVTAKRSGTAKITATIKFVNGGSKTITRSIKVK